MNGIKRRHLLGGLALSGGLAAMQSATAEPASIGMDAITKEADVACAYHCDFGDPARVGQMITNINNHLSVYENDPFKIKIVVVAHGQGIKPFLTDFQDTPWSKETLPFDLFARYEALGKLGVDAYLCRITFANNKIDLAKAKTAPFIKMVPSGVATVASLQAKGFAYIKVG